MCSFPSPDAIESATSMLLNLPFSFSLNSCWRSLILFDRSTFMNWKCFSWVKLFAKSSPTIIIFSQSPCFIRPETCAHVSWFDEISAISSMLNKVC